MDKRCSVKVPGVGGWYRQNCSKPVRGTVDLKDYCAIHHPDTVKKRQKKSEETYRNSWPQQMLRLCETQKQEIESLKSQIAELKETPQ